MHKQESVFFDIDDTLIRGQSQKFFMSFLYREEYVSFFFYIRLIAWFLLYQLRIIKDPGIITRYAFSFLKNMPRNELIRLVDTFFNEVLIHKFHKEALPLIAEHKRRGRKIFLVSNAFDSIVSKIACFVDADGFISTQLEEKEGVLTGQINGTINYDEEKVKRVLSFCYDNDISLENSWGYADHISDIAFLKLFKNSIVVNPDSVFKKEATILGFKILKFKK
ncbi:hypothetical protein AUJ77_02210 [Candidatus Nomurabacteria bacterium CG1_02_43_90]|uniref:HAD family hydrolase n=1 Tax=Candidatus Nomurabacteria bacterium CG1_02_43_90 TaxID=1805281 RepID=A0A1J4V8K8_9BACT|nr:MAG: hypothetical protein AUJ77_02210 [Candidatus Nomurabacteria bacterium CG1_02_43_90]